MYEFAQEPGKSWIFYVTEYIKQHSNIVSFYK